MQLNMSYHLKCEIVNRARMLLRQILCACLSYIIPLFCSVEFLQLSITVVHSVIMKIMCFT